MRADARIARVSVPALADRPNELAILAERHPGASLAGGRGLPILALSLDRWADPHLDLREFDRQVRRMEADGPFRLLLVGGEPSGALAHADALLLRYQRLHPVRNGSGGEAFERAVSRIWSLHPSRRPLGRPRWEHAVDVWQWGVRLSPDAGLAVQLAALLHDVEWLDADLGANAGDIARDVLGGVVSDGVVDEVAALLSGRRADGDGALLGDSDALSFLSLDSDGYLEWFGAERAADRVARTWEEMSPRARARVPSLRLSPRVAELLPEALVGV